MAPVSLTPTTPAKEYIYAGGKLVATEELTVFQDVAPSSPFYEDILKLAVREVTVGCHLPGQPPRYCPDSAVTREQLAIFFMRAKGEYSPPTPAFQWFNDVGPERAGYAFVERMWQLQIRLGCGANYYCPDYSITHAHMAAFVCRANEVFDPPAPLAGQAFCDVPSSLGFFYRLVHYYAQVLIYARPGKLLLEVENETNLDISLKCERQVAGNSNQLLSESESFRNGGALGTRGREFFAPRFIVLHFKKER